MCLYIGDSIVAVAAVAAAAIMIIIILIMIICISIHICVRVCRHCCSGTSGAHILPYIIIIIIIGILSVCVSIIIIVLCGDRFVSLCGSTGQYKYHNYYYLSKLNNNYYDTWNIEFTFYNFTFHFQLRIFYRLQFSTVFVYLWCGVVCYLNGSGCTNDYQYYYYYYTYQCFHCQYLLVKV